MTELYWQGETEVPVGHKNNIKTEFVPRSKHTPSRLYKPAS